jgi:hypothetical protein
MSEIRRQLQQYLEPVTAAVALALTLLIVALVEIAPNARELAVLAPVAWLLQSLYLWRVRRAGQRERERVLREVGEMLRDQINNQLMVILATTELTGVSREDLGQILAATRRITTTLDGLSEDSLANWRAAGAPLPTPP